MSECIWAVVTRCPSLGTYKQQMYVSVVEAGKSEIRVPAQAGVDGCLLVVFSWGRERASELSGFLL